MLRILVGEYCLNMEALAFEKEYVSEMDQLVTLSEFIMSEWKQDIQLEITSCGLDSQQKWKVDI